MMAAEFRGMTVCCMASGPSLTQQDVDAVRDAGIVTVVVNRTFEIAPWAQYIYAGDDTWWMRYHDKIPETMERWTCAARASRNYRANLHVARGPWNSGLRALQWAVGRNAKRVILLGYDCKHIDGRAHWHDNYPALGNAVSVTRWPEQFAKYARQIRGRCDVVNCSPDTALTCFLRQDLQSVLRVESEAIEEEVVCYG